MLWALVLTAGTALGCVSLGLALDLESRAERLLAAMVAWNALIVGFIYALAWRERLTAFSLGLCTCAASLSLLVFGIDRARPAAWASRLGALALAPSDVMRSALRARSIAAPAIFAAAVLLGWELLAVWLLPSWRSFDCLWYHEPIIGFTLQSRGFAVQELPDYMQRINGYPRVSEMTSLWFVIFSDRRLIELPSVMAVPLLGLAIHVMCRRAGASRHHAGVWGASVIGMRVVLLQTQSTLVDVHLAALLAAAIAMVSAPRLTPARVAVASLSTALALGTKYQAIVPVGVIAGVGALRMFGSWRELARLPVAAAPLLAMGWATYWRNWKLFHNPFWPHKIGGFDWPGWAERGQAESSLGVTFAEQLGDLQKDLYAQPFGARVLEAGDVKELEYGLGFTWVILPFSLIAFWVLTWVVLRWLVTRERKPDEAWGLALASLPCLVWLRWTPNLAAARYQLFVVAVAIVWASWVAARARGALQEALVGAVFVLHVLDFCWREPSPVMSAKMLEEARRTPYPAREWQTSLGAGIHAEYGELRERTVQAGDVIMIGEQFGFPAIFWNDKHTNVVRYGAAPADFVRAAQDPRVKMIHCTHPCRPEEIELLGFVSAGQPWNEGSLSPIFVRTQ